MKTQISYFIKYDLRGHSRSYKITINNQIFLQYEYIFFKFTLIYCPFMLKTTLCLSIPFSMNYGPKAYDELQQPKR